jgi:aquaporin Z
LFEAVATALFAIVILGATCATGPTAQTAFARLAIGITLAAIGGIQLTGVSVNPDRGFGPAILAGAQSIAQLWLIFAAPAIGAVIDALIFRLRGLDA